jgi:DNA-binding NarL/FixJ family response regulator
VLGPFQRLRVAIADDHPRYRSGLARQLRANGIEVVAEVPNAAAALDAAIDHRPDVVIMDLNMPGVPPVEGIRRLGEHVPCTRVVVLTVSAESPDIADALLSGAAGYVLKDDMPEHIIEAVCAAADGETPISPRAASMLLARARRDRRRAQLEGDELGVLELLADGRPVDDIGASARRSVREQLVGILLKLAVEDLRCSLRPVRGQLG